MNIIDCRNRPTTKEFMEYFGKPRKLPNNALQKPVPREATLEEWMSAIDEAGIASVVVTGRDLETSAGWKVSNDYIASVVNFNPKRITGVAGLDPLKDKEAVLELERAVRQLGLCGGSIDPARCGLMLNDKRLYPVYEKCAELDVPVFITMGPLPKGGGLYLKTVSPMLVDEVATEIPDLKIVCSHATWPFTNEMIAVAFRHRNVYIEMSSYWFFPGAQLVIEAANLIIPEKVLFATAYPFNSMKETVSQVLELPFTEEVKRKVMHENASNLFKVNQPGQASSESNNS